MRVPRCHWVLANPRGTFVLVFPEKIKICQVDVVRVGMRAGEGLHPLGGQVADSPGSASQPTQAAPRPTHPCPRAPSPLCPSLRGPGLGVKRQPQGHMAGEDTGVGAQVSLASPGLSQPLPRPEGFIPGGHFHRDSPAGSHSEALGLLCHWGMGRGPGDTGWQAVTSALLGAPPPPRLQDGVLTKGRWKWGHAWLPACISGP